ncbi:hypothetical protein EUX98_g3689 [Antrodiella citrinella]|uniref:Uncharacterized protein n=1 Tax=Antrodiella citrinella TaxID=2447956 RepID=A0A4S4MVX5_9APHY|nr:hypothetical protein EUX98_g3689 [Antrodiella citrinella]
MSDSQPPEKRKRDQTKYFESLKSLKPNAHILKPTTKSSSKSAASSTASSVAPPSLSAPIRPRAASVRTEDEDDAELNKTADEIIEIGSDDDAMEVDPEKTTTRGRQPTVGKRAYLRLLGSGCGGAPSIRRFTHNINF